MAVLSGRDRFRTGYALVLLAIASIREIFGFGSVFGIRVLPAGWIPWTIMVMAPAGFFMLALFIWVAYTLENKTTRPKG